MESVRVEPGISPPSISTTPNSPTVCRNVSTAAATIERRASGASRVHTTRTGTFAGKCAELCGAYHARMLFNVKVVSEADYKAHMQELRAKGNVGKLGAKYDRNHNVTE